MQIRHLLLLIPILLGGPIQTTAQTSFRAETQVSASTGDHEPLWLNANKYGLSSLNKSNGYLRAAVSRPVETDSLRRWGYGYAADVALAYGFTSKAVVQQAYGEVRWLKGLLTVGSKEQPAELKNQELSSGAQTLGINARPLPSVRLSLPHYWTVPYTRGWLGIKGHIAYGMQTDDGWQKDFTQEQSKYIEHAKLHTKAGYLRIGKEGASPVSVEMGLEMACQYGGTSHIKDGDFTTFDNEDGLKGMFRALFPGGGDSGEGIYANEAGNHLGSYLLRVNMDYDRWALSLYADHFFEDHSQMFFIDYDGYGEGEEFNEWKHNRWFIYDLKDIMLGVELKLKNNSWLNDVVVEYLYTKYQSGPVYHDRTYYNADHIAGRDNYYNNYLQTGWQHWGQVMGNPLYRSPLYNDDGIVEVKNNRFVAWHLGVSGEPAKGWHYRLLATWQRGYGTYDHILTDKPTTLSGLIEASYAFSDRSSLCGWSVKGALGADHGDLYGKNVGVQLSIIRKIKSLPKPSQREGCLDR